VDCVVAQRLARKLCSNCKRKINLSQTVLEQGGFHVDGDIDVYEAVGCTRCIGSGYRGRIGLFSVMVMSEMIKDMAVSLASEAEIAQAARQEGMLTVKESGLTKVREGLTSIEEVARVAN
jgi:type IV pilus assembly protein PilB